MMTLLRGLLLQQKVLRPSVRASWTSHALHVPAGMLLAAEPAKQQMSAQEQPSRPHSCLIFLQSSSIVQHRTQGWPSRVQMRRTCCHAWSWSL